MLNLHFIFAPHYSHHTALPLAEKINDLEKSGHRIVFVGSEAANKMEKERKKLEKSYARYREKAQKNPMRDGRDFILFGDKRRETIQKNNEGINREELERQVDLDLVETVAASHGLPFHYIEYAGSEQTKRKKLFGKKANRAYNAFLRTSEPDKALQHIEEYYQWATKKRTARHTDMAKNILKLLAEHEQEIKEAEENGKGAAVLIRAGPLNRGLEKRVANLLEKNGVKASVTSTFTGPTTKPLILKLIEEKCANPRKRHGKKILKEAMLELLELEGKTRGAEKTGKNKPGKSRAGNT